MTALQTRQFEPDGKITPVAQQPDPTPMMGLGRFEVPELPENPTQVDLGANLYFYHCMPCHGDYGQGLTDEFREAWVDDHQNCWARGCHTGRPEDEGFPIPKYVPPVIAAQLLVHFPVAQELYDYLITTHPPQNPGVLSEDEYWSVTAFLWFENGQLPSGVELGPQEIDPTDQEASFTPERQTEAEEIVQHTQGPPSSLPLEYIGMILLGAGLLLFLGLLIRRNKMGRQTTFTDVDENESEF